MTTAKAAVLTAYNQPLEIREYPVSDLLAPGEALVRVEMAGICGTDVHLWKGELPVPIPIIMGHETVGRISRAGAGLERDWKGHSIREGDRITWASSIVCGECFYCRIKRQPTRCLSRKAYGISYTAEQSPHLRGGHAEVIALRAGTAIFRLADELETAAVVGAGCALATAIHGTERCPVTMGDIVVVQGTGPVGLAAIAVSRQAGAQKIVAIGGPPHRLELAKKFGADVAIDFASTDMAGRREQVLAETGGFGADIVLECAGAPAAVNEGIELCRDGARYLVLGQYANAGNISFNPHLITRKQLQIAGSWGFEPRHVDRALDFLSLRRWSELFAAEVTHRFPLAEANAALETVRDWRAGKTVLTP